MKKLLISLSLFVTCVMNAMDDNELGLIKLPDAATLTTRLNEAGFSDLVAKTDIINLLAEQKKSFEDVDTVIGIVRREYLRKTVEQNVPKAAATKQMCELMLNAKTESLRALILPEQSAKELSIIEMGTEILQELGELMPLDIFMTTESDSE